MKKILIAFFGVICSLSGCKKGESTNNSGENLLSRGGISEVESPTPNYLTFDQSFIDFVYYATNNLGAGQYINRKLGSSGSTFISSLKQCNSNTCITTVVSQNRLSIDTLDEYFFSAIAGAVLFRVAHPEFDNMSDVVRTDYFLQAFITGMNSGDPRWVKVKENIYTLLSNHYSIEIYKPIGEWTDYVNCFMNELKGIFIGALSLGTVVEAIKTGNVAKGLGALKSFLKSGVGRALSWIGVAIMAWDIFECCWDVSHSDDGGVAFIQLRQYYNKNQALRHLKMEMAV